MGLFDGVDLRWGGWTVTLTPDRLLGALARLEEHVSLAQLSDPLPRYSRLALGFAAVLRYAGIPAEPDAVFATMLVDADARQAAHEALGALLASCTPPASSVERSSGRPSKRGLVETMAKAVVGNGWASPSEFRAMHPQEVWWLIEAKRPPRMITKSMTEDEAEEIYAETWGKDDDA